MKTDLNMCYNLLSQWWTADLNSLLNELPSNYSIRALMPSVVLQISKSGLEDLYQKVPSESTQNHFSKRFDCKDPPTANHAYHAYDAESGINCFVRNIRI
ncbi:MAG: hypothetical protein R2769_02040 [Saprospiraceae bacterium]